MAKIIAPRYAIIQRVDAALARAYLQALPDIPPDERALQRVRFCLGSLQSPDVRYLVATVLGPGATGVARVTAAVLRAAGARTGVLGRTLEDTAIDGAPIDDTLIGQAGTLTASSGYQLQATNAELGELTRREGVVILALTAFAEASERVALLMDEEVLPHDPVHAPVPDLVVVGNVDAAAADRAIGLVPDARPAVVAPLAPEARDRIERSAAEAGKPMLLGGRDHAVAERDGRLEFLVRGEPYVTVDAVPGIEPWQLATGVAAALALGVMGIRMREEWVVAGLDALRKEPVGP